MAIRYVKVKRTINVGNNPGEKYLARIFREQQVDLKTISEQIAGASSMSPGDVMAVLQQLQEHMSYHLLRGASVNLDLLGTFAPAISAKAVNSADEVTADTIRRFYVNYRPSVWLTDKFKEAKFSYANTEIQGVQTAEANPTPASDTPQTASAAAKSRKKE